MERRFDSQQLNNATVIAHGIKIFPDVACGKIVFDADKAVKLAQMGEPVILAREEITPDDIEGIKSASGIITSSWGNIIFIASVCNTLKKCCIFVRNMKIDNNQMIIDNKNYSEQTQVSLDGHNGNVYLGTLEQIEIMGHNDLAREQLRNKMAKIYSK